MPLRLRLFELARTRLSPQTRSRVRSRLLRDLKIYVAVAIDLLAKGDVNARKRNMMFPVVAILPVELVSFNLIRGGCLDGVIGEGN
jgi:hypothetical protein